MPKLQRLHPGHAPAVLAFEMVDRSCFAAFMRGYRSHDGLCPYWHIQPLRWVNVSVVMASAGTRAAERQYPKTVAALSAKAKDSPH